MRWENLTMPDFARAVTDCDGVGIIPIGVLEPHSTHMPLGTDMFESHWIACKAAEREPALVFPQYCCERRRVVADNTVFHDRQRPSKITLPVTPST